jgi:tetratricopeptide (TPR) repeat protein
LSEADRYFELGLEQARMADDVSLIVKGLNARGAVLIGKGDLNQAALILEQALEISMGQLERPELDSVLGNLGMLALKAKRPDDARDFWLKAIDEANGRSLNPILYHCNLARLERGLGNVTAFQEQAQTALALTESELGATEAARADAFSLAALTSLEAQDETMAETYLTQALELDRKNENQSGLAQDLETLAGLQAKSDRPEQAAASLDRAFYLWVALGDRPAQERTLASLENLHQSSNHPKSIDVYRRVYRNPSSFDPINRLCPY